MGIRTSIFRQLIRVVTPENILQNIEESNLPRVKLVAFQSIMGMSQGDNEDSKTSEPSSILGSPANNENLFKM
jgi:hypothetical protein